MALAEAGALNPSEATDELYENGLRHLFEATHVTFLKNVYGGLLFGFAGLFSLIVAAGSPGLEESNPGLARLLQGFTFPSGLVIIYFIGAELFTGYPMWLMITALQRKGKLTQYALCFVVSWIGNLVGAVFSSAVFSYATNELAEDPYKSGLIRQFTVDIIDSKWHIIFVKAIGCGFLVTLAMSFGTQNHDGISKALGLHLPFFMSTTASLPHTVEFMYLGSISIMLGAPLSVGGFLWKSMLPITLGNATGGAVFVGAFNWYIFLHSKKNSKARDR